MSKSIKIRAKSKHGLATIKTLVSHPMEPGNRKNAKTGKAIKSHFIQTLDIAINGKSVLQGFLSGGVSKNPYLSCKARGNKGDTIMVSWVDNQGNRESTESRIK